MIILTVVFVRIALTTRDSCVILSTTEVNMSPYVGCVVQWNNKFWVMDSKKGQTVTLRDVYDSNNIVFAMYWECVFVEAMESDFLNSRRKEGWKQDNPQQQLVVCNQNVLGHIENLREMVEGKVPFSAEIMLHALDSMERSAHDVMELKLWMKNKWA